MVRGNSSAMAGGKLSNTGAISAAAVAGIEMTGLAAGGSGMVSPGSRCLENSSRVARYFGVIQPASLMGAS